MNPANTVRGLIALESQNPLTHVLDKQQAAQFIALVAQDLAAIIQDIKNSSLVMATATYPVEQILQVNFPIHSRLQKYAEVALQGSEKQQHLLSIGGNNGHMPDGLQPLATQQHFMLMPFLISGLNKDTATRLEQQLMHKGMIAPPSYAFLCQAFGQQFTHVNYMTTLDLVAMMHNHYDQMGQGGLWQLIEYVLVGNRDAHMHHLPQGNFFYLLNDTVYTPFFSPSEFKKHTEETPYIAWLLQQRLSVSTLRTHGLNVAQFKPQNWDPNEIKTCLGQISQNTIQQSFMTEANGEIEASQEVEITHYQSPEAGLVAIAICNTNKHSRIVYYPVEANGIRDIEQHIATHYPNPVQTQDKHINDL
ncbi:hypothetical protein [Marinicella sp. W31]|uniref:hypothetical protein n=1 Tax=Marinicella sp. W31 TaxID=3023713 RepID=UPI0037564A4F